VLQNLIKRVRNLAGFGAKPENVAVYTALTNNYDDLKAPTVVNRNYTYIVFVDSDNYTIPYPWQPRKITITARNPRVTSRYYKLLPHRCLPEFDYSIWVDASLLIKSNFESLIATAMRNHNLAVFRHHKRNCIYEEAACIVDWNFDAKEVVEQQMEYYRRVGYPANHGLIAGGLLIRKHHDPLVKTTMNEWWEMVTRFSQRDQLSANFVFWKHNLPFYVIGDNIRTNQYVNFIKHPKPQHYTAQMK
jgi:hypothetical protein